MTTQLRFPLMGARSGDPYTLEGYQRCHTRFGSITPTQLAEDGRAHALDGSGRATRRATACSAPGEGNAALHVWHAECRPLWSHAAQKASDLGERREGDEASDSVQRAAARLSVPARAKALVHLGVAKLNGATSVARMKAPPGWLVTKRGPRHGSSAQHRLTTLHTVRGDALRWPHGRCSRVYISSPSPPPPPTWRSAVPVLVRGESAYFGPHSLLLFV